MTSTIRRFGTTSLGQTVEAITLRAGEVTARVLTLGATLQDLRLAGTPWPLVLGSDLLGAYEQRLHWCGAVVGPVANRLFRAQVTLEGQLWQAEPNDGANLLHSGAEGISQQVWTIEDASEAAVTLRLDLPHGAAALPGNRVIRALFALSPPATLEITLSAETDALTLMNLAHHPYWNLDGTATTAGHRLQVMADHVLPTDAENLPLPPVPVVQLDLDLRSPRALPDLPPVDHNFCLSGSGLRPAARLTGAKGVTLDLHTDAPGVQVYDGRALNSGPFPGLMGAPYAAHAGVALEPQLWPDAPRHADFPSILLAPATPWRQRSLVHLTRAPAE
ncbi:aldose epimerase family protein [Rhodobacter capsulatus]|uniref:aldose epimerase family protein n=1 Tax=Rhodobacter capsulatus TaxID=1061 RepID=UPI004027FC71